MANLPLIKEYFNASGKTFEEIASTIGGIEASTIEDFANGLKKPKGATMLSLPAILNVNIDDLNKAYS